MGLPRTDQLLLILCWIPTVSWNLVGQVDSAHFQINHFYPRPVWNSSIVVACVWLYVCVCVNPELVRKMTHHPFKLEPPIFFTQDPNTLIMIPIGWGVGVGVIDLDLQDQI